jgi:hypothetical protein
MKGQKDAVVELVHKALPSFVPHKDIALVMLSRDQLESIKHSVGLGIMGHAIEYSKPRVHAEVMAYARSMVMNHLKKAKELNGGQVYGQTPAMVQSTRAGKKLSTINMGLLPEELRTYVKTLV